MATGHSQAPRLGGSCHSMPADCCHICGFSKRSQRLTLKKKKKKKHESLDISMMTGNLKFLKNFLKSKQNSSAGCQLAAYNMAKLHLFHGYQVWSPALGTVEGHWLYNR